MDLQEKIKFEIDTSAIKANSLGSFLKELKEVDAAVEQIYTRLGKGPTVGAQWLQSVEQIKTKLDKTFKQKGPYAASDALKAIGLDQASINQALVRLNELGGKLTGFRTKTGSFGTVNTAALGVSRVLKAEVEAMNKAISGAQTVIGKAFSGRGPGGGAAVFSGKDFNVKVEGSIPLVIQASQIQARIEGIVQVKGSAEGGVRSAEGGIVRDAQTGRIVSNTGGKKKSGGGAQALDIGEVTGETGRVRTERLEDGLVAMRQEAITRVNQLGEIITDTHDSVEGIIKTVTKSATGQSPLARYRQARQILGEQFRAQKALLDPDDTGHGLAALYTKQASELRGLASPSHPAMAGLPAPVAAQAAGVLQASAQAMEARALGAVQAMNAPGLASVTALQARQTGTMSAYNWQNFLQGGYGVNTGMPSGPAAAMRSYYTRQATAAAAKAARAAQPPQNLGSPQWSFLPAGSPLAAALQRSAQGGAAGGGPFGWLPPNSPLRAAALRLGMAQPPAMPPVGGFPPAQQPPPIPAGRPAAKPSRIQAALTAAFSPQSLAVHTIKAAGWATAITAIYKPLELAEYSLKRFMDLGEQVAHLSVVFRGVGGSTKELTEDVLKLASANGRTSDEAMESATEWARLGMNRVEINKAVQVSLEAANVAQVSVGEATKQMAALMHIYGLNVNQLDGALGMLVNTSQKFNVTTEDLMGGLDRSAAAAKVAGVSFAELQGLIGATVGGTGQSGVQIGNTLKNFFTQFTRPEIQQYLQTQGIATTAGGKFGNGSDVLQAMFLQYQKMDPTQRRNLATVFAGRLQSARFAGLMAEYPEAQQLAIEGLLRQGAATGTNALVTQNLGAQLRGLESEWDRTLIGFGGMGPRGQSSPAATVQFGRGLLSRFNDMGGGQLLGFMAGNATPFNSAVTALAPLANWLMGPDKNQIEGERLNGNFNQADKNRQAMQLIQRQMDLAGQMQGAGLHTEGANKTYELARKNMAKLGLGPDESFMKGSSVAQSRQLEEMGNEMRALAEMKVNADNAFATTKDAKTYKEQLDAIEKLGNAQREQADEVLSSIGDQIARKQEYIDLLKEETSVMEVIGRLAGQVQTPSLAVQAAQQSWATQANIESLQASMRAVAINSPVPVEANPFYQDLAKQLSEAKAQQAAVNSPRYQAAVNAYDDRAIAIRRAQGESGSYAVGFTEAEKLVNQQTSLERELGGLRQKRDAVTATDNDLTRGMELQVELAKNHEQIQMRIVELQGQQKQILIDSIREYQKGMLLAGPGELLKRLYAGTRGNLNAGEFMSLDPQTRRFYMDLHGGEAGMRNTEERNILRGQHLTVTGEQAQSKRDRDETSRWVGKQKNPTAGMPGLNPPKDDPLMTQAYKSAQALSEFTTQLVTATNALASLDAALRGLNSGGTPAPSGGRSPRSAPPVDVSPGHALGAQPSAPVAHGAGGSWDAPSVGAQAWDNMIHGRLDKLFQ